MLVVDANVVVYLLVEGEKTAQARDLWTFDHDWHAPQLLLYELTNVFCRLIRQRALLFETALAALDSGVRLVRMVDQAPPAARILEIGTKLRISAYDACYLATAETLRAPVFTEDTRLLRAAPEIARSLESFQS